MKIKRMAFLQIIISALREFKDWIRRVNATEIFKFSKNIDFRRYRDADGEFNYGININGGDASETNWISEREFHRFADVVFNLSQEINQIDLHNGNQLPAHLFNWVHITDELRLRVKVKRKKKIVVHIRCVGYFFFYYEELGQDEIARMASFLQEIIKTEESK